MYEYHALNMKQKAPLAFVYVLYIVFANLSLRHNLVCEACATVLVHVLN